MFSSLYSKRKFHRSYFKPRNPKWPWGPLLGTAFAVVFVFRFGRYKRNQNNKPAKDWEVTTYRKLPLRPLSRAWGWAHSVTLPVWARTPVFAFFVKLFNCDMREAEVENYREYKNLSELFRRSLKPGLRPISYQFPIVSPADGTLLDCGKVEADDCYVDQVKGISYSLPSFLGPPSWTTEEFADNTVSEFCSSLLKYKDTSLYQAVIYLAPGDYHRFHSPADWTANYRRHFSGELLSVSPTIAKWIPDLFTLNERVVYFGEWEHGFFCFVAVGATNVGSIHVYEDEDLRTNLRRMKTYTFTDKNFSEPLELQKGVGFGEFNFGSSVVLLFEAPDSNFQFAAPVGSKIRYGESLFMFKESDDSDG